MTVLVTGGAGYIGGHVVRALADAGRRVVVVDDLSTGRADRVPGVPLLRADLADAATVPALAAFCAREDVTAVVHLAARKRVDESVRRPRWYARQNVGGTAHLLEAMAAAGAARLVLSSSAAVYGSPPAERVAEDDPTAPVNPYGATKLACEQMLRRTPGLDAIALRYFNVAGAASAALRDDTEDNLVTTVLARLAAGEAPVILGDDYATADGTCVRDLVHVADVADAHVRALTALEESPGGAFRAFNVGTGRGVSVRAVAEHLIALDRPGAVPEVRGRRPGDPAAVVADVRRIARELGWTARRDLDATLRSAWSAARALSPAR